MLNLLQSWGGSVVIADSAAAMIEKLDALGEAAETVISNFGLRGFANGVDAIAGLAVHRRHISKGTYTLAKNAGLSIL